MGLAELKKEIAQNATFQGRSREGWEAIIRRRAIHVKYGDDLEHAIRCYVREIPRLRRMLALKENQWERAQQKLVRLMDKLACCLKEQELRKAGEVIRNPHHTTYYIDYGSGNDANTGLSTGQSWKTITQYTTTTVRSAGDIALLRANVTWTQGTEAVDITCDEDGTLDAYISIIGCDSVTNDPWSDGSDVKPIIDFEDAAYQIDLTSDDYWWLERLDIQRGADTNGYLYINNGINNRIKDCKFSLGTNASSIGVKVEGTAPWNNVLDGCTFVDNNGTDISNVTGVLVVKDCTFNAGSVDGCDVCMSVSNMSEIHIHDGSIGSDAVDYDTAVFSIESTGGGGQISGVGVTVGCTLSTTGFAAATAGSFLKLGDCPSAGDAYEETWLGTITRTTADIRAGGGTSMAKMEPSSAVGLYNPLVFGDVETGFRAMWGTSGAYTATVYVRTGSAWDSALTAAECYLMCSYLDHSTNATRTFVQSTETITNDAAWTALTCSLTPQQEGWMYFWIYLAEYEDATEYIEVDILPVVVKA